MKVLFFFLFSSFAFAGFEGTWEGAVCEGTSSLDFGGRTTYIFSRGTVETYFQKYADQWCQSNKTEKVPEGRGIYTYDSMGPDGFMVTMAINNALTKLLITINGNTMTMCAESMSPCWTYTRR